MAVDTCFSDTIGAMEWSKEEPTSPGLYWFKGRFLDETEADQVVFDAPAILEITNTGMGLYAKMMGREWWRPIDSSLGEWAGPLKPPEK